MEKLHRPYCVDTSLILWVGVAVLGSLQLVMEFIASIVCSDTLSEAISEGLSQRLTSLQEQASVQGLQYSPQELSFMARAVPFTSIFMELVILAILLLVVWRFAAGRKWARFALTFFACYMAFQAVSAVVMATQGTAGSFSPIAYYLQQADPQGSQIFPFLVLCIVILQGILALAALLQMRKLDADKWFNERQAQRRPPMPPMPPLPPVPPNGPHR